MDIILEKINKLLEPKFPDPKLREEALNTCLNIIMAEGFAEISKQIPDDTDLKTFTKYMEDGDYEGMASFAKNLGLDIDDIFEQKCKSVMIDLFN